ncbi:MAG TPA: hypothetical protein VI699_11145 [Candidatus Acidoferrales bacterium]|nr:hypothetical protein [Candidatus Acidoferrales bacterium]
MLILVLLTAPAIPLGIAWRRALKGDTEPRSQRPGGLALLLLLLVSASCLYFLLGMFANDLIGEDYSPGLYAAININLGVMLTATFAVAFLKDRTRIPLLIGALLVALNWFYMLVVNSVV